MYVYVLRAVDQTPHFYFSSLKRAAQALVHRLRYRGLTESCLVEHDMVVDGETLDYSLVVKNDSEGASPSHVVDKITKIVKGGGMIWVRHGSDVWEIEQHKMF